MSGNGNKGLLTVVIPIWDRHIELLARCVSSLSSGSSKVGHISTDVSVDIVVVDNASETPIPKLPAGVQLVRLPARVSLAAARNVGLAVVKTPFVAFLDADDEAIPSAYAELLGQLEADDELVAATGALTRVYDDGRREPNPWPSPAALRASASRRRLAWRGLRENCFPTASGAIMRTDTVRAIGGFGMVAYHEDWALSALLAWHGRVHVSQEPAALYHYDDRSRLHALSPAQLEENTLAVQNFVLAHRAAPRMLRRLRPLIRRLL